jgi:hypothetical protein
MHKIWRNNSNEFRAVIHGRTFAVIAKTHEEAVKKCTEYIQSHVRTPEERARVTRELFGENY